MGLFDPFLPNATKLGVATNILLAEYNLYRVPTNAIKVALSDVINKLHGEYTFDSPHDAYIYFFSKQRNVQLNMLALAFKSTNTAPLLSNEMWTYVKTPMLDNIYCAKSLSVTQSRIYKTYGEFIEIPKNNLSDDEIQHLLNI